MMPPESGELSLRRYPLWRRGKVRDVFDAGDRLIFVATDRVSAFDVILPNLIPGKGQLLTDISRFWFESTRHICPNHVIAFNATGLKLGSDEAEALAGRTMQVRKAERIDVECVVRARLAGSGWSEYQMTGTLAGEPLPNGLSIGDSLPEPRFTPAAKKDNGHDVNLSRTQLIDLLGDGLARQLERLSMALFEYASAVAQQAGFILADTKFEFGYIDGELALIDEALTPDSSRFWDTASMSPANAPPGYDKQVIRDWLTETGWTKEPPAPSLPEDIIRTTHERYAAVRDRLLKTRTPATASGAEHR